MTNKEELLKQADDSKHWEKRHSPAQEYLKLISKETGEIKGKKILDVGCAEGIEVDEFSSLGMDAEGVDIKPEFIQAAQNRFPNNKFKVGSAEKLPYSDNGFDVSFCLNTLFYTDIEKSIPEMLRVVKSNGIVVFSFDTEIFNFDENKVFHSESFDHLEKVVSDNGGEIKYTGEKEERLDETPFRHKHTFYKIIVGKK
ncbi:MAG: class I SAM-dependent methyltransferase [bacterium]